MKTIFFISLIIGLFIRLYLLTKPGFAADMLCWQTWAQVMDKFGILNIYTKSDLVKVNYPPVFLYILWIFTQVGKLFGISLNGEGTSLRVLLKLPTLFFDSAILLVTVLTLKKYLANGKNYLAGIFFWLNPAIIYAGTAWGQVDSLPVFFILLTIRAYLYSSPVTSGLWLALAISTKFQSVILLPFFIFLWWKKSLADLKNNLIGFCISILIIHSPFILSGQVNQLIQVYIGSIDTLKRLSANAWNLWWPVQKLTSFNDTDSFILIRNWSISYRNLSLFLLFISVFYILLKIKKELSIVTLLTLVVFLLFSFFILPTQIHERYLLPAIALISILAAVNKKYILIWIFSSILFLLNLIFVLPIHDVFERGFSWSIFVYRDEFGIYASFGLLFIYYLLYKLNSTELK